MRSQDSEGEKTGILSSSCDAALMSWDVRIVDQVHQRCCMRLETVTRHYFAMVIAGAGVFVTASLTLSWYIVWSMANAPRFQDSRGIVDCSACVSQ